MNHPLPFIKELDDVPEIKNLSDILRVNEFVYSLIVAVTDPYNPYLEREGVEILYNKFIKEEIGGWCGLNAYFFMKLMEEYDVDCRSLNYGDLNSPDGKKFHVVCIVKYEDEEFLMDPYINKHYCYSDMRPMPFNVLIEKIKSRQMKDIYPVYGKGKKKIFHCHEWKDITPKEFDEQLTRHARQLAGDILIEKFGSDDPYLLMLT